MKTLFISRLDNATTEADLEAEFSRHGPIRSISLIKDLEGRSRGYAFIEYERTGDMKAAYKAYPPDGFVRIGEVLHGRMWKWPVCQRLVQLERRPAVAMGSDTSRVAL
jgi:RNA recognition motif-containing protein